MTGPPRDARVLSIIRYAMLALVALGTAGMVSRADVDRPSRGCQSAHPALGGRCRPAEPRRASPSGRAWRTLRLLQFVMLTYIGTGVIGITLHFKANAEFQREIDPSLGGLALFWKVVEATAPPALAPGVMVQLGLLGLVYTLQASRAGRTRPSTRIERTLMSPRIARIAYTSSPCSLVVGLVLVTRGTGWRAGRQVAGRRRRQHRSTEADSLKVPHMTPAIAKAMLAARPFDEHRRAQHAAARPEAHTRADAARSTRRPSCTSISTPPRPRRSC